MKSLWLVLVLSLSGVLVSAQSIELKRTKISDDISLQLPVSFTPLTEQEINEKMISSRKPLALYGDQARVVDFGVNVSMTSWSNEDLTLMKQFFKSSIMNLYDTVNMITEEMQEINGEHFAVFEFISSVTGDDNSVVNTSNISKYTYLQYALINGKTILFNFSCPARLQDKWAFVAEQIMQSVKIKKSF
ncbi:MAG: hypothetical protein ACOCWM_02475 [Cyclobacteriaceae bacterium]